MENATELINHGLALAEAGKFDEAKDYLEQCLKKPYLHKHSHEIHLYLARLYFEKRHIKKAHTQLMKALELKSNFEEAKIFLQVVEMLLGLSPEEVEIFVEVEILNSQGLEYAQKQDFSNAEEAFRRCIELNQNYEPGFLNLSRIYAEQSKYIEAEDLLKIGVKKFPENGALHNNLGFILEALKKLPEALFEYERALEINPQDELAQTNLELVKKQIFQTEEHKSNEQLFLSKSAAI